MVKRSLQASAAGIQEAKKAFARKGWTQENLAEEVNLRTRQPIWRFFTGRPIERHTFLEICSVLELDWRQIAIDPPAELGQVQENSVTSTVPIDVLVQEVRSKRQEKIQDQCGMLHLLDINQVVKLNDIYIDVNILKEIASQQILQLSSWENVGPENFNRIGLGDIEQKQIPSTQAADTYAKLRVLGKPGSGKTTFLQHLAIQCNQGSFARNRVVIFITLRNFAEESKTRGDFNLLNYIRNEFLTSDITDPLIIERLLREGRVLLLLDGMDEILTEDISAVLREIRRFYERYYKNRFVVTCRTASPKLKLRGFTDVEIAPFSQAQIVAFSQKWFALFSQTNKLGISSHTKNTDNNFILALALPENWKFRQLVLTPLFLHLACRIFSETAKFPTKEAEFYKQGIDLLLVKWDELKGIERDDIYQGFLLPQKIKLLSQIAIATFEKSQYFFEQNIVERHITDYVQKLLPDHLDPEGIQLDSEVILKAIESQHGILIERSRGIFSFAYLVFQEYFTARQIVANYNLQGGESSLSGLVSHITEAKWHEIFLFTVSMLQSADSLLQLMKQEIDLLVAKDPYLQEFLTWATTKSQIIPSPPKEATVRAFYLALARTPFLASHFSLASAIDQGMLLDALLDDLVRSCELVFDQLAIVDQSEDLVNANVCINALSNILTIIVEVGLHKSLADLREQLPEPNQNWQHFQNWWTTNHLDWIKELRKVIENHRLLNHQWKFTVRQTHLLKQYYDANQLLLDCLNSNSHITPGIKAQIESTLLLSQQELEEREWQ